MPSARSALGLGALAAFLAAADVARADHPVVVPGAAVNPAYCWPEVKLFDSLRHGPVAFCRRRLAYRPGRLECTQVDESVCWVLLGSQWTLTRTPVGERVFPCPEGPEPPVCPRLTIR
jgi:hypothetical protein